MPSGVGVEDARMTQKGDDFLASRKYTVRVTREKGGRIYIHVVAKKKG